MTAAGDSPEDRIEIRPGRRSDRERAAVFTREAYSSTPELHLERMDWQFFQNPFLEGDEIGMRFAWENGRIVGKVSVIPVMFKYGDRIEPAYWACELTVLPSHRRRNLAFRLVQGEAQGRPIFVVARMNRVTRHIMSKVGCRDSARVWTFLRPARFTRNRLYQMLLLRAARSPFRVRLVRWGRRVGADAVLAVGLNLFGSLWNAVHRPSGFPGIRIREAERFGEEADVLWERVKTGYVSIVKRDREYLNWRFCDHPRIRYRCFLAARNGQTVGYAVLRTHDPGEPSVGYIVDFLTARGDEETLGALLRHSIEHFGKRVAVIQCETSTPEVEKRLRRLGFLRSGSIQTTYFARDPGTMEELGRKLSDWFLTRGDQDMDQIRPLWSQNPALRPDFENPGKPTAD